MAGCLLDVQVVPPEEMPAPSALPAPSVPMWAQRGAAPAPQASPAQRVQGMSQSATRLTCALQEQVRTSLTVPIGAARKLSSPQGSSDAHGGP